MYSLLAIVAATSLNADARGRRGGGHSYSHSSYSSHSYSPPSVSTSSAKKPASKKKRVAKYAAVGTAGYAGYQAHNYASSYVREKGRQDARNSSTKNNQPMQQAQAAPTCAPIAMAAQPGYTNLPICQDITR